MFISYSQVSSKITSYYWWQTHIYQHVCTCISLYYHHWRSTMFRAVSNGAGSCHKDIRGQTCGDIHLQSMLQVPYLLRRGFSHCSNTCYQLS